MPNSSEMWKHLSYCFSDFNNIVFGSFEDIVNYRPRSFSHKSLFSSRYDLRFHLNLSSPARWSHTSLSSPVQRSLIHYLPPSWTILSPPPWSLDLLIFLKFLSIILSRFHRSKELPKNPNNHACIIHIYLFIYCTSIAPYLSVKYHSMAPIHE